MISKQLLDILVCPISKRPLRLGSQEELDNINEGILSKTLKNSAGSVLNEAVEQVLLEDGSRLAYLLRNDIPVLIEEEAIQL